MTHRFPIKEIARQAGLGPATVDRALNNRPNVSPQTKRRVADAIAELTEQEAQLAARGRRLFFDFVVEAPARFSREVQSAAHAVLPQIGSAVCRPRFLMQEVMAEAEVVDALSRIAKRGSHGVCLKARDTRGIRAAVTALITANIPVVTLVTDIAKTDRLRYVGLDNAGAGRTAAYLIAKAVGPGPGKVLATLSHERFLGEEEREGAFVAALAKRRPDLRVHSVRGGRGVDFETSQVILDAVPHLQNLRAVYSMGGGNCSILQTLQDAGVPHEIYVAHDLDAENKGLIETETIDYILHHDLKADIRNAFDAFLQHHRLSTDSEDGRMSVVQIITPANIPDG